MKKQTLALLMLVLGLLSVVPAAMAAPATDFIISAVDVDDQELGRPVYVERGSAVPVEVFLQGVADAEDVRVRVWLGGYEFDEVSVTSAAFDMATGVRYKKTLYLDLPQHMDSNEDYTVYVEAFDSTQTVEEKGVLRVNKVRHQVSVQDVIVSDAEAGDYVSATVRLENTGDHKEEDIKVTFSVEELNVKASAYVDELTNTEVDNEDEESSNDVTLTFQVPRDAVEGTYTAEVTVEYNRGYEVTEETTSIHVSALETLEEGEDSTVKVVLDGKTVEASEEAESSDFSTALRLGFGILAVLIVILALILIVRR